MSGWAGRIWQGGPAPGMPKAEKERQCLDQFPILFVEARHRRSRHGQGGGGGGRRPSRLQSITQSSTGQDHSQEGFSESENVEPVCHIPVSFESCCCLLSHSSPYLLSLLLLILTSPSLASSLCSFNCCSYQLVHPSLTTFSLLSQALHVTSASVSLFATLIHSIHLVTIFTNTLNNS